LGLFFVKTLPLYSQRVGGREKWSKIEPEREVAEGQAWEEWAGVPSAHELGLLTAEVPVGQWAHSGPSSPNEGTGTVSMLVSIREHS
jgi:hypothetical protein